LIPIAFDWVCGAKAKVVLDLLKLHLGKRRCGLSSIVSTCNKDTCDAHRSHVKTKLERYCRNFFKKFVELIHATNHGNRPRRINTELGTLELGILELSHGGCPLRISIDLSLERSAMELGFIKLSILELSNGGRPLRISTELGLERARPQNSASWTSIFLN